MQNFNYLMYANTRNIMLLKEGVVFELIIGQHEPSFRLMEITCFRLSTHTQEKRFSKVQKDMK